ncbi:hypothetical protein XarjCFBP8253_00575 [Xanthomonas arboricola pv. juglandis]|nr:hypothetical protein XarjCFBP8253_00575 [Xanthomonas arboricola pv. juglandis]
MLQAACCVHVVLSRRALYWIFVLIAFAFLAVLIQVCGRRRRRIPACLPCVSALRAQVMSAVGTRCGLHPAGSHRHRRCASTASGKRTRCLYFNNTQNGLASTSQITATSNTTGTSLNSRSARPLGRLRP